MAKRKKQVMRKKQGEQKKTVGKLRVGQSMLSGAKKSRKMAGLKDKYTLSLPKIKVVGIGGAGGNALTRIFKLIKGIETIALNTDIQDLRFTQAHKKVQIGKNITQGRGAGMNPELGKRSVEESREEVAAAFHGAELVFITCGLGGGTGSGAAPVVAEICRSLNIITIAVVTLPFSFEGKERMQIAQSAWNNLVNNVDALITVSNDRVFNIIDNNTSLKKAFWHIDEILREGVQSVSDVVIKPGLINVDFADLKAIVQGAGPALLGIGVASGEDRAVRAAERATAHPLIDITIDNAKRVLFNISASTDLTMFEVQQAAKIIADRAHPEAKIIFGANFDYTLPKKTMKIAVVACGFDNAVFSPAKMSLPLEYRNEQKKTIVDRIDKEEASPNRSDVLIEKLRSFELLEEQPAFLRKRKKSV